MALKGLVKVKVILFKRPYLRRHQIRKPHNLVCPGTFGRRGFLSKTSLIFVLSAAEGQKKDSNAISVIVEQMSSKYKRHNCFCVYMCAEFIFTKTNMVPYQKRNIRANNYMHSVTHLSCHADKQAINHEQLVSHYLQPHKIRLNSSAQSTQVQLL